MFSRLQMKGFEKGSLYMILSSLFVTIFALFVKMAITTVFLPLLVFLRFLFPLIMMVPYFCFHFEELKTISLRNTSKHFLRGIAVVLSQYSLFYYFTKGSLTDGVLLLNTAPLFMPMFTFALLRYKVSRVVWVSLIVSFVGVICVLKPNSSVFDPFSIYGFIAGGCVAMSQVLFGINRENDSIQQNIFLFFLYSTVISLICFLISLFWVSFETIMKDSFYTHGIFWPIFAVVCTGLGSILNQFLRGRAYKLAKPASLAPFIYLSVVFAAILDQIIHPGTIHGFNFFIGMLLVLLGSLFRILHTAKA